MNSYKNHLHLNRIITAKISSFTCCLICLLTVCIGTATAKDEVSLEDKTKAAFLYHFTRYIQWPKTDSTEIFNIGVLGDRAITRPLEEISRLKDVGGRQIIVTQLDSIDQCGPCHILFIGKSEKKNLGEIIDYLKGANTLTVSDIKNAAKKGACINFLTINGKIRFEINRRALKRMHLTASSQLLKLAIIVNEENVDD